jgi:hypothetical protein
VESFSNCTRIRVAKPSWRIVRNSVSNTETANELKDWLCKPKDQEHFEQHWKILGDSGPERKSFPWNPSGDTSETCILAVDHLGKGFFDTRKTSSIPFVAAPRNF